MFQVIKTLQRAVKHCTAQQAREFATLVDREVSSQRLKSSASIIYTINCDEVNFEYRYYVQKSLLVDTCMFIESSMHLRCMCWFGNFVMHVHVTVVWTNIYEGKLKHGQKKEKFTDKKYM